MKYSIRKISQNIDSNPDPEDDPEEEGAEKDEDQDSEDAEEEKLSTFTKDQFIAAKGSVIRGLNKLHSLHLSNDPIYRSTISRVLTTLTSIALANPKGGYLENEFILAQKNVGKRNDGKKDVDDIKSAFYQSVYLPVSEAYNAFDLFIKYAKELVGNDADIKPYSNLEAKYRQIENNIIGIKSDFETATLIKEYSKSIEYIFSIVIDIKNNLGISYSVGNKLLSKPPIDNFNLKLQSGNNKYDLNNLPQGLKERLVQILKLLLTFGLLLNILKNTIGNNITPPTKVVGGDKDLDSKKVKRPGTKTTSTETRTSTRETTSEDTSRRTGSVEIVSLKSISGLDISGTNDLKIVTGTSAPVFDLGISGLTRKGDESSIFSYLVRNGLISLPDENLIRNSSLKSHIINIKSFIDSSAIKFNSNFDQNTKIYTLRVAIERDVASEISRLGTIEPINIFTIKIKNKKTIIKSALNNYSISNHFSKISFNIYDLIDDSSNISNSDKEKILNKIKK